MDNPVHTTMIAAAYALTFAALAIEVLLLRRRRRRAIDAARIAFDESPDAVAEPSGADHGVVR